MKISVVMTMCGRTELLKQTLFSFCRWYEYNIQDVELVIVEDVPYDKQLPMVLTKFSPYFERVILVRMDKTKSKIPVFWNSPALGINLAVKHASNECILKTDPECLPITNLIAVSNQVFSPDKLWFFTVRLLTAKETELFSLEAMTRSHPEDIYKNNLLDYPDLWALGEHKKYGYWFGALFSRQKFMEIGGVDEEFLRGFAGEDDDYAERMRRAGVEWDWSKQFKILHQWHGDANKKYHLCKEHRDNIARLNKSRDENRVVANVGYDWGSDKVIKGKWILVAGEKPVRVMG